MKFEISHNCADTSARAGKLFLPRTPEGVETPCFMPVGTQATVKSITQSALFDELGYRIILGNTYHLYLRPGHERIQRLGQLPKFMSWKGSMLTDSGGFQVFSMNDLNRVSEHGVTFKSHLDGSMHLFTPEHSISVQHALGADIIMAFDECPAYPATRDIVASATERTHRWADRCLSRHEESGNIDQQSLFGICQGGAYEDLRRESAQAIASRPFPGIAIGGVSVGEPTELMRLAVEWSVPHMPEDRPRYLMGVGTPQDLVESVAQGIDMFDCVMPTRSGRTGTLYTSVGKVNIKGLKYAEEQGPVDPNCSCLVCKQYSAAYLRHLYRSKETLGGMLATYHNLAYYKHLMEKIRDSIVSGTFLKLKASFIRNNC